MVFRFYSANLISCLLTALALALLSVCSRAAAAPWPAGDGVEIGNGFVSEPSGAVVLGDRLWIVSDEGRLWSMGLDGSGPTSTYLGGDLEGVTSANGLLYVAVENPDGIREVDPSTGLETGESWDLTPFMAGPDNQGLEALTFAEGLFYAGLQSTGQVFVFDLAPGGSVAFVGELPSPLGYTDISGLHFSAGVFYAIHDGANRLMMMEVDELANPSAFLVLQDDGGEDLNYQLQGINQEGIAIHQSTIYVAEDSGNIYIYDDFPVLGCDEYAGAYQTWYADDDEDGFGNPNAGWSSCMQPAGTVQDGSDCDDADEFVGPAVGGTCGRIPTLSLSSLCPAAGLVSAGWSNATPNARVVLVTSPQTGQFAIPAGHCAGVTLGLDGQGAGFGQFFSDSAGGGAVSANLPASACSWAVQLIDLTTCTTSAVIGL